MTVQATEFDRASRPAGLLVRGLSALRALWLSPAATRVVSIALFAATVAWVLHVFRDYGISNDEPVQHTYGQLLWAWYESGFTDDRAFHYINLYLYGGLFDLIAAGLDGRVPLPTYELRHLLSATFGIIGIFGTWNLARLLAGEKTGIVAALILVFTGMYGGAMFTHTKDVPFAAAMVWSLYFVTCVARGLPGLPAWRHVAGLGVAVGCAMGLRVGGVFAVLYLLLTVGGGMMLLGGWRRLPALIGRLAVAGLIALAIMAVSWPWSVQAPGNIFTAMGAFSNFAFDLSTLINGVDTEIDQVPRYYMSEYLAIKLPEITLLGVVAALGFGAAGLVNKAWRRRLVDHLPLVLALAVPIVFTLVSRPPLYNGIRHFLFVIPVATVIGSIGLAALFRWSYAKAAGFGIGVAVVVLALFAFDAAAFIRLHPYEYVGYNQLVGGLKGATGRFEGDYWSDSLRQAAIELRHGVEFEANRQDKPYTVAVCAEDPQVATYLGPKFRMVDDWDDADFFISATNIGCDSAMPGPVYRAITRDGVALSVVIDTRAHHREMMDQLRDEDSPDSEDTSAVDH